MNACKIDDCGKTVIIKKSGLCNAHYIRLNRYGRLNLAVEKHGMCYTSENGIYRKMKQRCLNPNDRAYKNYGGRGIKVCDRWLSSFENFYRDMGDKPTQEHTIERIDNNGDYEPSNCKWIKREQQNRNRRNVTLHFGKTLGEWADLLGVKKSTMRQRYYSYGWSIEACLRGFR